MHVLNSNKIPVGLRVKEVLRDMVKKVDRWQDMAYFLRRLEGLTQEEYAEKISVSRVTVEYWETARTMPGVRSRAKVYWECILFCKGVCGEIDDELKAILQELGMKICTITKN